MAYQKLGFEKTETVDTAAQVGQVTEGVFLGSRQINVGSEQSPDFRTIVDMEGKDGPFAFWASTSIKMLLPQIQTGTKIRITYRGKQTNPKTKREFKAYDVESDTSGLDSVPA